MATAMLKVEGMTCGHCKTTVEKAAKGVEGVSDAAVDLGAKEVKVTFDGAGALNKVKEAITDAGYEVAD